jgi:hypothetical protein
MIHNKMNNIDPITGLPIEQPSGDSQMLGNSLSRMGGMADSIPGLGVGGIGSATNRLSKGIQGGSGANYALAGLAVSGNALGPIGGQVTGMLADGIGNFVDASDESKKRRGAIDNIAKQIKPMNVASFKIGGEISNMSGIRKRTYEMSDKEWSEISKQNKKISKYAGGGGIPGLDAMGGMEGMMGGGGQGGAGGGIMGSLGGMAEFASPLAPLMQAGKWFKKKKEAEDMGIMRVTQNAAAAANVDPRNYITQFKDGGLISPLSGLEKYLTGGNMKYFEPGANSDPSVRARYWRKQLGLPDGDTWDSATMDKPYNEYFMDYKGIGPSENMENFNATDEFIRSRSIPSLGITNHSPLSSVNNPPSNETMQQLDEFDRNNNGKDNNNDITSWRSNVRQRAGLSDLTDDNGSVREPQDRSEMRYNQPDNPLFPNQQPAANPAATNSAEKSPNFVPKLKNGWLTGDTITGLAGGGILAADAMLKKNPYSGNLNLKDSNRFYENQLAGLAYSASDRMRQQARAESIDATSRLRDQGNQLGNAQGLVMGSYLASKNRGTQFNDAQVKADALQGQLYGQAGSLSNQNTQIDNQNAGMRYERGVNVQGFENNRIPSAVRAVSAGVKNAAQNQQTKNNLRMQQATLFNDTEQINKLMQENGTEGSFENVPFSLRKAFQYKKNKSITPPR